MGCHSQKYKYLAPNSYNVIGFLFSIVLFLPSQGNNSTPLLPSSDSSDFLKDHMKLTF